MRVFSGKPTNAGDLEYGCVDWFDYERHAEAVWGWHGRPRTAMRSERHIATPAVSIPTEDGQPWNVTPQLLVRAGPKAMRRRPPAR